MLTKCLALESLALELKLSPMLLRGLEALPSWSLKISAADLPGFNQIGTAWGVRPEELAGFPRLFVCVRYMEIQNSAWMPADKLHIKVFVHMYVCQITRKDNLSICLILGDLGENAQIWDWFCCLCLEAALKLGLCSLACSTAPSCWNALGSHREAQITNSLLFLLLFCKKTLLLCETNVKVPLLALWQCLLCSSHCCLSHQVSNTNTCRCLPPWQEVQRPWADILPPCSWAPRPPSFLPSFLLSSACRYFSLIMCFFLRFYIAWHPPPNSLGVEVCR